MAEDAKPDDMAVEAKEEIKPKSYTPEEIAEIARRVETPRDNTPPYRPEYKLSPEFDGTSNYELAMKEMGKESVERLERLQQDPDASPQQIREVQEHLKTLDYLYENYNLGMNVFRTAKGGRDKLRA